ncbi:MAG: helix-turn-helix domain-containing protein [bacterium]|nr:helix-turn-helix domain-containing protein [bacterium]
MRRLTIERERRGMSKMTLAHEARLNPATLNLIENRGLTPYSGQLQRLSDALGYTGNPAELLAEVG